MLKTFQQLRGYALHASDGDIGVVRELYFECDSWTVRYLVVDTGSWLDERQVLIVPNALGGIDIQRRAIEVGLTKQQIHQSPPFDSHQPVSRQYEEELRRHYACTPLQSMAETTRWGAVAPPNVLDTQPTRSTEDSQLHSSAELLYRYSLVAQDGEVGYAHDFIIDEEDWSIPYMIVRAGDWLLCKNVLVGTEFVKGISYRWAEITLDLLRFQIKQASACDPAISSSSQLEQGLNGSSAHEE